MVQPQIASDGERFIVGVRAKSDLSVNAICNGNYTTNLNGKIFGVTATSYRFGGQTRSRNASFVWTHQKFQSLV